MTALEFIKRKQKDWAEGKGFILLPGTIGSETGNKIYFDDYNKNLYAKLSEDNKNDYNKGSGGEIRDTTTRRAPMKAAFSSSAIVVNLFQYWQGKDTSPLLEVLVKNNDKTINTTIKFEDKFEIDENKKKFPKPANLDVTIELLEKNKIIAIESKFTEPYGSVDVKISKSYLEESLWNKYPDLKKLKNLTENIYNKKCNFQYLDAAQLIKHILGLKNSKYKENFTLLYLWYDVPNTKEAKEHQEEIEAFASIAKADGINFRHITYQKVIENLNKEENKNIENFKEYINYLEERYKNKE